MNPWNLTPPQCATLDAMSRGDTAKVTAKKLGVSYRTLESHMHSAMTKMDVPNRLRAHLLWDRHTRQVSQPGLTAE